MLSFHILLVLLLLVFLLVGFALLVFPLDLILTLKFDAKGFKGQGTLKGLFFSYVFSSEAEGEKSKSLIGKIWRRLKGKVGEKRRRRKGEKGAKKAEDTRGTKKVRAEKLGEERQKAEFEKTEKIKRKSLERKARKYSFYLKVCKTLLPPLFRLFSAFLGAVKFQELDCFLAYGFENPADTGLACGILHGIKGGLETKGACCRFIFSPNFLEPEFRVQGKTKLQLRPYRFGLALLKFCFDWQVLRFAFSLFLEKLRKVWPKI
ncbi:MAG: DUF2953 domain-containing protein [Methanosarcinaceae archaeon]|nr:DUF2953 domain-containing protein [Methanosarcinaceae archaeon]